MMTSFYQVREEEQRRGEIAMQEFHSRWICLFIFTKTKWKFFLTSFAMKEESQIVSEREHETCVK